MILRGLVAFFSFLLTVEQKLDHTYLVHQPITKNLLREKWKTHFAGMFKGRSDGVGNQIAAHISKRKKFGRFSNHRLSTFATLRYNYV